MIILPTQNKNEITFWELLRKNETLDGQTLLKHIPKTSLYRIFKKIQKIQKNLNTQLIKKQYRERGGMMIKRELLPTIQNNIIYLQ